MTSPEMEPNGDSIASKAANEKVEKHVRFPENDSASVKRPKAKPYSRRIVVGGKNNGKAKPLRDIGIFVAVLAVLLFLSRNFEMSSLPSDEDEEEIIPEDPFANKLNKIANAFAKFIQADMNSKSYRNEPCDVFLRLGSIPNTGYSLFAGKKYTQEDMIPIPGLELSRWLSVTDRKGNSISVAPHAMLLKHHPNRSNVQGLLVTEADLTQSVSVRATRDIREGEELYVDFQHHPARYLNSLFDYIPSTKDHEIATEIRRDVANTGKRLVQGKRKKSIRINPAPILSLIQRSMEKVRPQVAALLHHETMYEPLLFQHKMSSFCPSDFVVADSTRVRTKYAVNKGETLTVIPLYHWNASSKQEGESESTDWTLHCASVDKGIKMDWFCPLTMSIQHLIRASDDFPYNVELKWTERNELHSRSDLYAWDLVAMANLAAGEELKFPKDWKEKLFA